MLSYQHIYHAGNFADAHKHALLVKTLAALKLKSPQLFLIDTHAGRGLYDFRDPEAQRKQEFKNGIAGLLEKDAGTSPIADYLAEVKKLNPDGGTDMYPGSPLFAKNILRSSDRMVFAELHPSEFEKLRDNFKDVRNVTCEKKNGLALLLETTPPKEQKGIAVIDPPYEIKTDYTEVPRAVGNAVRKWPQGVFFIWYPILTGQPHLQLLTDLRKTAAKNTLVSEIKLDTMPKEGFAMYGTGIAIVNCPLAEQSASNLTQYIAKTLPQKAFADTYWLDNKAIDSETGLVAV